MKTVKKGLEHMIGTHLQSASNTLDVIIQSGDWKKDEKLKRASVRLQRALDLADQLPELASAYRAAVDAYAAYTRLRLPNQKG